MRAGVSDGDVNPVDWAVATGIGGKGVIPSRPNDSFGIGVYHTEYIDEAPFSTFNIDNEQGFEAWYNVAVTPWFHVTADLQIIDSALSDIGLDTNFIDRQLTDIDTAWVMGLRTEINF